MLFHIEFGRIKFAFAENVFMSRHHEKPANADIVEAERGAEESLEQAVKLQTFPFESRLFFALAIAN
jgi:hypothetical protein